jgi:pyruvate ferredoxin oxidoreductase delta subunit
MISKILPELFSLQSVQKVILNEWKDPIKAQSAAKAFERSTSITVRPDQGNPEVPYKFDLPKWHEMGEGIAIPSIPVGHAMEDPSTHAMGGFQPDRNPTFKKFTTRTMRPVLNFETCIKCTLCWLHCPDSCFDVTPDELYDANMQACCGCGVCEAVCPVTDCLTMVNEAAFADNASQWQMWKSDKQGYDKWLKEKIAAKPERSHGFRYRGQYEAQVPEMLNIAQEG